MRDERSSMGGNLGQWLEKKNLKKLFRRDNMVVLILVGVLLFIIALPVKNEKDAAQAQPGEGGFLTRRDQGTDAVGSAQTEPGTAYASDLEYAKNLESRLTEVLSGVSGVGEVRVMITLKSSAELVVEKEMPVERSYTTETDSQGGSRTVHTDEMGETVVYSSSGNDREPYVVKTYVPQIEGILVVAEGAGSGTVNRTITDVVQALFDVEIHKVKVVKMETKSN